MNWQHMQAFLWLRWRLLVNQLRRGGIGNIVILSILGVAAVFASIGLFVGLFVVGVLVVPNVPASVVLYVWDGLVVAFLFSWMVGLVTELQRSEVLSLEKFLHLPVSLTSAFLINYLSSLVSVTLLVFGPAMIGFSVALVFAKGPAMLLVFPLLAAFVLMVSALSYQFQGWLASLMVNKRRRRTVIAFVTIAFVLLFQLPNLVNFIRPWEKGEKERTARQYEERAELQHKLSSRELTPDQYQERLNEIAREENERTLQTLNQVEQTTRLINVVLPPGWLPLGALDAAGGEVLPALLGTVGLSLIGAGSLWRSYRTTVRLYTGQFSAGRSRLAAVAVEKKAAATTAPTSPRLLEKSLPWVSEQASAIALGGFRSLTRAPEAKMLLLSPAILLVVFGSMLLTRSMHPPEAVRPLMAYGAMAMILLTMVQLVGNQFGFDRGGFRVFVLCPASRRDILLGKNLAIAPLAFGLCLGVVAVVQVVYPMRLEHLLAAVPQLVSMFLLFCLLANCLSILSPMPMAAGSVKPLNPKGLQIVYQFVFMFLFPLALAPTLLPLGVEFLLESLGVTKGAPICLVLAVLECVAVAFLYRFVLSWQGAFLQRREQRILETVTTKAE